eukprot:1140439-Pelagomonas_calceolata.AAC.1
MGCQTHVIVLELFGVLCLLRNTWCEEEEEEEEGAGIWRLCCVNLRRSFLSMSTLTKPAPKGLLLRALMIILPATVWRSVFILRACRVRCLIDDTPHTLEPHKKLGLGTYKATKLARKPHAHSVQYAYKLTSTRRALKKTFLNSHQHDQAQAAASNPLDPY